MVSHVSYMTHIELDQDAHLIFVGGSFSNIQITTVKVMYGTVITTKVLR